MLKKCADKLGQKRRPCYTPDMFRIWAKIVTNHKVQRSIIHECSERLASHNFFENMRAIAEKLHIPTPIVLNSHCENFLEFNILKLRPRDFIEAIPFDFLVLECADE